jgi:hypothetical protein
MSFSQTTYITRGTTVYFTTTFFNQAGAIVQPDSATINIVFPAPDGSTTTALVVMTAPTSPATAWTAQWDSRGAGVGAVSCSVHTGTDDPPPVAAEDFTFTLTANPANLVTF